MPSKLVDVEAVLVDALAVDADLAALIADRIGTRLPETFPDGDRVVISRIGGTPVDEDTEFLDRAVLQIESYGSTKADAFDTIREAMRALLAQAGRSFTGAVITKVVRLSGPTWTPEPETFTPRYLMSVAVWVHPR